MQVEYKTEKEMKTMQVHSGCRINKKLHNVPDSVPLDILNENQSQFNHNQTLDRLNERGGLSILEILNNIDMVKLCFRAATQQDVDRLNALIYDFLQKKTEKLHTAEEILVETLERLNLKTTDFIDNHLLASMKLYANKKLDEASKKAKVNKVKLVHNNTTKYVYVVSTKSIIDLKDKL